jgi:hypothetical protein
VGKITESYCQVCHNSRKVRGEPCPNCNGGKSKPKSAVRVNKLQARQR